MKKEITEFNPQELRIGNFVNFPYKDKFLKIKVAYFDLDAVYTIDKAGTKFEDVGAFGLHEIEPIPIDETWLRLFGFIDEDLSMSGHKWLVFKRPHLHKMDIRIAVPKNDNDWSVTLECVSPPTMVIAHLKYVHQLQNLIYMLIRKDLDLTKANPK